MEIAIEQLGTKSKQSHAKEVKTPKSLFFHADPRTQDDRQLKKMRKELTEIDKKIDQLLDEVERELGVSNNSTNYTSLP